MPSLNPFTSPPRSLPMLRSFFVPKISSTITSRISQWIQLIPPMMSLACRGGLALRDHARKRVGAADDVDMKMIHVLTPHPAGVDDGAEAVRGALLAGETPGAREHFSEDGGVCVGHVGERVDVPFRDDHEVHRRDRIDVVEGEHVVVLVHLAA